MALTITPDGVRRPVAASAMALLLALAHKLLIKDRLTRSGRDSLAAAGSMNVTATARVRFPHGRVRVTHRRTLVLR